MSMGWCRLWHEMPTDPKFRSVAKRAGRPTCEVLALFTAMLANASANEERRGTLRNWCNEDEAIAIDIEPEAAEAIYAAMQGKLLDGDRLTGWERRQPKREDSSTDRVRAYRERKKADSTRHVTPCNAHETHGNAPDKDTDTEREVQIPPTPRAGGGDDDPPDHVKSVQSWDTAFARPSAEIAMRGAAVVLLDGARTFWLDQFGGNGSDLDLALMQAAGEIRPNSRTHPLEAQVSRVLARIVQERRDRDRRYQAATERNKAAPRPSNDYAERRSEAGRALIANLMGNAA